MTVASALLLVFAAAGLFRLRPHALPPLLVGFYWFPSWLAQSFALPLALVALGLSVWQSYAVANFTPALAMAALAALFYILVHMRNRRNGYAMLRQAGSAEQIPLLAGLWPFSSAQGTRRTADISYGEHGTDNLLDVIGPDRAAASPLPVLIHIHGGAWTIGNKNQQALPLLRHMARSGWLCLDINYRLGPDHRFPAMVTDILRAIAWARDHVSDYGGDPGHIFLTGGSAGGHLTALAALVHDDASLKPGFEAADCSVAGAVPLYGRYDFLDRHHNWGRNRDALIRWKAQKVMPCAPDQDMGIWNKASPLALVRSDAPPMWIVHGRHDTLLHVEDAAQFAEALRRSGGDATYTELTGGQHAYEICNSALTVGHVRALQHWLGEAAFRSKSGKGQS